MLPLGLLATMLMASLASFAVLVVDRQERLTVDGRFLSLVARESVARSLFWVMRPLGATDSGPVRVPVRTELVRPPVLLVSGSTINRAAFAFLRTFLTQRGIPWVWAVNPEQHRVGLADAAVRVQAAVDQLRAESGSETVDIVGFCSGGLVAAWYARHLDPGGHTRRLVTIGTPWRGSKMAVFQRGRLGVEMAYGAHLLDDLVPSIPTTSIWSTDDPSVVPSQSACPDTVLSVEIEGAGHEEMLMSSRVFRAVQAALS